MKAKIMGKTIEIPDGRVGVAPSHVKRDAGPSLPGWPARKDKWNYAYAQYLEMGKAAGHLISWFYEPFSLWLPGGVRYKPDFLIWRDGAPLELVEVKGWSRNLRDGITRYKIAAALYPCFCWKMVTRKGHRWEEFT